jgi:hypothetical protein
MMKACIPVPSRNRRRATSPALATLVILGLVVAFLWPTAIKAQLPAFPGAEGEGMFVTGGRGGDVYRVFNLNNSGVGSLRYGIENAPAAGRTIVFDVAGVIPLASTLRFTKPNVTVAGQTAPGLGIYLRNYGATVSSANIILRHLRFRPGDANKGPGSFTGDSLSIGASRVMVDHCSASWGIDECLSAAANGQADVTVQYCFITEGLDQTGLYHDVWDANYNPGGPSRHSMGSLLKPLSGNAQLSFHHNFWAANGNRNPAVGTYNETQSLMTDIRNNVLFNNRNNGYRSAGLCNRMDLNYVGNYIIAGPETASSWRGRAFDAKSEDGNFYIYQSGNKSDGNLDLIRNGTDTGWGMFAGTYNVLAAPALLRAVTTHTADQAYCRVINGAGALPWSRDSVDARLIQNLLTLTGEIIDSQNEVGGYPIIPVATRPTGWDTDNDGIPDYWETAVGWNPQVANHNHINPDGYTDLEHYLNWLADPHAVGAGNTPVDVNLREFTTGMATNATYIVTDATNGMVALLGDGRIARFTPVADFYGRASFRFAATDPAVGAGGALTNTVSLLITPPPPRFESVIASGSNIVLRGAGGIPASTFYLLTATNATLPAAQWTRVATNQFDGAGNFVLTNSPNPEFGQTFYRLQVP